MYASATFLIYPTLFFPHCVHKIVLYVKTYILYISPVWIVLSASLEN